MEAWLNENASDPGLYMMKQLRNQSYVQFRDDNDDDNFEGFPIHREDIDMYIQVPKVV